MTGKATPGPLQGPADCMILAADCFDGAVSAHMLSAADGRVVALVPVEDADGEAWSRLLGAAPELLAALGDIADAKALDHKDHATTSARLRDVQRIARAAFAKATGEGEA